MMAKPTLQFRNLSELQVAQYAENILVKMTENANLFPEPVPSLEEFEATIGAFKRAYTDAAYRDRRMVEIKNEQFEILKLAIFDMSLYVSRIAQGNRSVILSAGFIPNKMSASIGIAPKPSNLRAEMYPSIPGMISLRVNVWKPASMYFFEYRKAQSNEDWVRVSTTRSNTDISGLESFQVYEFRVAYATSDPTLIYSDVISSYAL